MYELKVTGRFAAAHNLRQFHGKCEDLHGHNWLVEVYVVASNLDDAGLVMDFGVIKKRLAEVLEGLDHKYLNEIDFFQANNPSSENIARFIFDRLAPRINAGPARLVKVSAWESDNACATYIP
ncbi:MAG: 6-carboxytetrahydropterin synthase QueD [Thermodesulfobacteriota bacterium]